MNGKERGEFQAYLRFQHKSGWAFAGPSFLKIHHLTQFQARVAAIVPASWEVAMKSGFGEGQMLL